MKRIISFCMAVVLLTSVAAIGTTAEKSPVKKETETKAEIVTSVTENGYKEYLESKKSFLNATDEIILSCEQNFTHKGNGVAVLPEGVALTESGDSVSFSFNVEAEGLYEPEIEYCGIEKSGGDIELTLLLDGKLPYSQAENFYLYRLWENAEKDFSENKRGDEYSPEQNEVFNWQKGNINDSEGFVTEPLCLALSKGTHTLTLTLNNEAVKIKNVTLKAPETLPTYAEYKSQITGTKKYNGKEIVIEGEKAELKSQKSFVPQAARNDAEVSPSDPYKKKINYIGGTNWNHLGGTITWNVNAPEDGWYKLGFHFRQNYLQEGISYRKLYIDGEIPFAEAKAVGFNYKSGWQYMTLKDEKNNEMPVFLTKGDHTIGLKVTLGEMSSYAEELKKITNRMGLLYRKIVKITGESPDANRDYDLFVAIPELETELPGISKKLEELAVYSEKLSGSKGGSNAQIMRKAAVTINQMLEVKYESHTKLSAFYDNYSSLCSWAYEMQNMALDIDTVLLTAPEKDFKSGKTTFFENLSFSFNRLLATYISDYERQEKNKEALTLWLNWGRDQITLLENLVANDFTPKTGIEVDVKITATTLVQAGLAGNGPDFQLNVARTDPLNYAMRGLLYDLKKFDDYQEITKRFSKTALVPYEYKKGVYGLPSTETFPMLFIRTDIFEELELEIPKTWDELINCAKVITLNNMNCGMTTDGFLFMTQMGVPVYNEDRTATNLMSAGAVEAYTYMTDFFTKYKFPKTFSFFNRFRTGLMPMAITNYAENATLRAAAPEISGKWRMVEVPGFEKEDGSINNAVNGTGTACVILDWSKKKDKAWEFLKWWTSDDIQHRFSVNIESILGASGRYESANMNAVYKLGWDNETLKALKSQFNKVENLPEVPGSYYVSRSIQQVYWNVVNNGQNVEDMLEKWIPEADDEIRRKIEEYETED